MENHQITEDKSKRKEQKIYKTPRKELTEGQ